ncbi:hypothetical protein ACLOJK_030656 [Asimina triloba]
MPGLEITSMPASIIQTWKQMAIRSSDEVGRPLCRLIVTVCAKQPPDDTHHSPAPNTHKNKMLRNIRSQKGREPGKFKGKRQQNFDAGKGKPIKSRFSTELSISRKFCATQYSRNHLQSSPSLFSFPIKQPTVSLWGRRNTAIPLIPGANACGGDMAVAVRDSAPQHQEFFEFFNDFTSEMCAADDVFLCGKLLPSTAPLLRQTRKAEPQLDAIHHLKLQAKDRKGSCSVGVDYRKLVSSPRPDSGGKACCGGDGGERVSRPKWYFLMFGSVVAPPTKMEMNDIRSRLKRGNSSDGRKTANAGWKLLRALSCQGHASAVVTPSAIAWQPTRLKAV